MPNYVTSLFCYFLYTQEKYFSGQDNVTYIGGGKSIGVK